jgi:hypothetical protein
VNARDCRHPPDKRRELALRERGACWCLACGSLSFELLTDGSEARREWTFPECHEETPDDKPEHGYADMQIEHEQVFVASVRKVMARKGVVDLKVEKHKNDQGIRLTVLETPNAPWTITADIDVRSAAWCLSSSGAPNTPADVAYELLRKVRR